MELREYAIYAGLYLLARLVYVLLRKTWPAEERRCPLPIAVLFDNLAGLGVLMGDAVRST